MENEKRLTWKRSLDGCEDVGLREGVTVGEAICKLADLEERDTVEVVRCKNCTTHGNCLTEDTFRIAKIDNPYCCVGKLKTNSPNCGAKMNGGTDDG